MAIGREKGWPSSIPSFHRCRRAQHTAGRGTRGRASVSTARHLRARHSVREHALSCAAQRDGKDERRLAPSDEHARSRISS
jgi:hypothetical protein